VTFNKKDNNYRSQITCFGDKKYLGGYDNARDAAIAYDTFVIVYGTEHTRNFG
jgi:hypothetical protein